MAQDCSSGRTLPSVSVRRHVWCLLAFDGPPCISPSHSASNIRNLRGQQLQVMLFHNAIWCFSWVSVN